MKHLVDCPLKIGQIVKMILAIDGRDNRYWRNKRDLETYTVIGILRDPNAQGGWMIKAQSETGRKNPWMSIDWYRKEPTHG